MGLTEDLSSYVQATFRSTWDRRDGLVVPDVADLALRNEGVNLHAVVLYSDLADSTGLVENHERSFVAEVFKAFLFCASQCIQKTGGSITAYDGDRVMGVFIGDSKNSNAAKCALRITYCVSHIINPGLASFYPSKTYRVRHGTGIDRSDLLVGRTGVRGANDLVWIGRAANYAAKLSSRRDFYPSLITGDVYDQLNEDSKYGSGGREMWTLTESERGVMVYGSTWHWAP